MIFLDKIDKYYNRHKKNKIHVIDNISLTLEKGLVALLGPSGCGKTTILNAIGGLDNIGKGKIYIDGKNISSKCTYKRDKIRNLNIGYIFQDYKLVDNLSVFDNVSLALKMVGIKDKDETKKRVEYVLEKVGMLRYKKRPAGMLSGGERQRVGIARALVKDPDIILADEPTGNLDSKNSLEIMKIIKAISKDRLVILVTHEQNLAKFYASRIIEIQDGKVVNDYENNDADELDYEIENSIYLKDFKHNNSIKEDNIDIEVYSNTKDKIKLDIVLKNGNIYIKSNTLDKVEVIEDNSSIEFINAHYKKIDKSELDKLEFNLKDVANPNVKKKYSSILNPFTLLSKGFKKVFDFPILKKILLIGFFISGMFIMYSTASIAPTLTIKDEHFVAANKNYLYVVHNKVNVDDYLKYEKMDDINYIIPGDSHVTFEYKPIDYYQTSLYSMGIVGSLSDIAMISENDLILGRMPENEYEIVIDKLTILKAFNSVETFKMVGLDDYRKLLNKHLSINNMKDFVVVGITDLRSPSIYTYKNQFINIIYNSSINLGMEEVILEDYTLIKDDVILKKGKWPSDDYEIIVNILNEDYMPLNRNISYKINGKRLKVVGYYASKSNIDYYLTNVNTIKYKLITTGEGFTIYSNDKENTISYLTKLNLNVRDTYEYSKSEYKKEIRDINMNTLIVSGIMLLISLIEMFLMIRASFLSRIKEIGIYRAIGVKRIDIYKMFYGEIFAITTLASVPGILFMSYILSVIGGISLLSEMFIVNIITILVSIVLTYTFNLIIGLLPVFNVVRKTPAQILARNDLE